MADATVSAVVKLLLSTLKDHIQSEIHLVRGVDKKLQDLSEKLNTIRSVLDDAERRRFTDKSVKDWLWRLEQTLHQMEDVLEEWSYAILKHKIKHNQKVCSFIPSSCFCFKKLAVRHNIASKVQDLKSKLDTILNEEVINSFAKSQPKSDHSPASSWRVPSTSLINLEQVQDRDDIRDDLVIKLSGSHEGSGYRILSIVGGGGLGKTTIAQVVYNHPSVKACFDCTIWICVSDPFNVADIAKGIIKGIDEDSSPDATQLDVLLKNLKGCISEKNILLVVDDVWNKEGDNLEGKWEPLKNALKCAGASSKILVTTRDERVAKIMGSTNEDIIRPGLLSDEDCWLLLSRSAALSEKREIKRFEKAGKGIVEKCKGLPLAAKTLGSLLRFKNTPEEWEELLKSEMWESEEVEVELFPHLLLSYHELSPTLKRCFSYCAFFPKDTELEVDELIRMWMALGYLGSNMGSVKEDMELKGRKYFQDLAMRSLLQDFREDDDGQIMSCKMHDIVHDFAQFVRKSPGMSKSACKVCKTNLTSRVKEYRGLSCNEGTPLNMCDCLTSLRVLKVGSKLNGSSQGMKKLIHLRWLDISSGRVSKEGLKLICKLYFLETLLLKECGLEEIPREIGNLVQLRHLDLSENEELKELPESMCSLLELQILDIENCDDLYRLPEGIAQLTRLHRLCKFNGGSSGNKLGLLKNLNRLTGSLTLEIWVCSSISDLEELVKDAQQAELKNKICLQSLTLEFMSNRFLRCEKKERSSSSSSLWVDVIEALQPNHNLQRLKISHYEGSKLPLWISSPHNRLRKIHLSFCTELSSLPPLGKLPLLESLSLYVLGELKLVGREWLGIRGREGEVMKNDDIPSSSSSSATNVVVAFPKLEYLEFKWCEKWEEWEDITAGEEESAVVSIMPCLRFLYINDCKELKLLPHRLLRRAQSLRELNIKGSTKLIECYGDDNLVLPLGDEYP